MRCLFTILLAVFLCKDAHAVSSPEDPLGPCSESMLADTFGTAPRSTGIRILVTRFSSVTKAGQQLGMQLGQQLRDKSEDYIKSKTEMAQTGFKVSDLDIRYIPCIIDGHQHARSIGQSSQVDVIFWGRTMCDPEKQSECQRVSIQFGSNYVQGSSETTISQVVKSPLGGSKASRSHFVTHLTVVSNIGLETMSQKPASTRWSRDLTRADFPFLASPQPKLLLDFALGLFAYKEGRFGLASRLFEHSQQSISAGVVGINELWRAMGYSYILSGESDKGLAAFKESWQSCDPTDTACRGGRLSDLAWAERHLGYYHEAKDHLESSLSIFEGSKDQRGLASTLHNMGLLQSSLNDPDKALTYYEQALRLREETGDIRGEALTRNNIGVLYQGFGEHRKAIGYYEKALEIWRQVQDIHGISFIENNLATAYEATGEKRKAFGMHELALIKARRTGDLYTEAKILVNIARYHDSGPISGWSKAIDNYVAAAKIMTQLNRNYDAAALWSNAANINYERGESKDALAMHEKVLSIVSSLGETAAVAATLNSIGNIYERIGQSEQALAQFQRAVPLLAQLNDPDLNAELHNNIGAIYIKLANLPAASGALTVALTAAERLGESRKISAIAYNLAVARYEQGQRQDAISLFERAAVLRRQMGDVPGEETALMGKFHILVQQGRVDDLRRELGEKARVFARQGAIAVAQRFNSLTANLPTDPSSLENPGMRQSMLGFGGATPTLTARPSFPRPPPMRIQWSNSGSFPRFGSRSSRR